MFFLVLLAMVAGFLGLRLYSVLGKRTGHEQPLPRAAEERPAPISVPRTVDAVPESREVANRNIDPRAEPGLRAIAAGDAGFDVPRFVDGAKAAYRLILEAFWRGDEEQLSQLVDGEVAQAFAAAIRERAEAGHALDNRLVAIEAAHIEDARVEGQTAHIRIRFDADIAAVTRDGEGQVVAGSMIDAVPTHDVWTFSRALKSPDPNWTLTETDEAA